MASDDDSYIPSYVPNEEADIREYARGRVPDELIESYVEKSMALDTLLLEIGKGIFYLNKKLDML